MTRILVVSATAAEAAHVPAAVPLVITGIGKVAAAVATTRALAAARDPASLTVVNIGTAGALRDGLSGLHQPSAVLNHDMNAEVVRALGFDPEERLDLAGGDGLVLATGDQFVTEPGARARLAELAHLVDVEGYAVAYAARRFGARVRLVKHVSDNADAAAMDWPTLVDASARELGAWLSAL